MFSKTHPAAVAVRPAEPRDRDEWLRMRDALWPGSLGDHDRETRAFFDAEMAPFVVFVAEIDVRLVGFLELGFRNYAEGCESSPVPFIEGWYVDAAFRGRGIGRALVKAAEAHVRDAGHHEIASDAELTNVDSIAAHRALGFEEIERIVCFRRSLRET
jgi:aminoglycoside 6'-N-acetyltransferase I